MKKLQSESQPLIWVLNDDLPTLDLLGEILRTKKWRVRLFNKSTDISKQLQTEKPHLLLIDFLMPDIDGLTLISQLRKKQYLTKTPIILMSADNRLSSEAIPKEIRILHKPFEMNTVLLLVKKCLNE